MPGACGQSYTPMFSPDNTWVEVLRLGPEFYEGGLYGCWFLAARGSGIYLNTGRSLRATNRSQLASILQLNLSAKGRMFLDWNPWRLEQNTRVCEFAIARGYDTVQLWWEGCGAHRKPKKNVRPTSEACFHEIISCQPQCIRLPTPCPPLRQHQSSCAKTFCPNCCRTCSSREREEYRAWNASQWPYTQTPCVHSDLLRTGWDASLPCKCDDSLRVLCVEPSIER